MKAAVIKLFQGLAAGRRTPRAWLLMRPGPDGWQWCCLPGTRQGDGAPPLDVLQGARVVLLIPAGHCSQFTVAAPPGLRRQEWPLLLEEQLQQAMDQVQVHCLDRNAGHLQLLVVDKARVQGWLAEAQALGLVVDTLWAEQQLMPRAEPGQVVCWQREQDQCLVRGDAQGRQQWLTWPAGLGDPPREWDGCEVMSGVWPERWAALAHQPSLLLAGSVQRHKGRGFTSLQRRLLALAGLLGVCWATVAVLQWCGQVAAWKAQVQAVTGPVSTVQQASRQLSRLQAGLADWRVRQEQLVMLEQAVGSWLGSQQAWGVSGSYFDGRTWRLVLSGNSELPAAGHWQALARQAGASASAEPSENGALLTVRFDLGAQP